MSAQTAQLPEHFSKLKNSNGAQTKTSDRDFRDERLKDAVNYKNLMQSLHNSAGLLGHNEGLTGGGSIGQHSNMAQNAFESYEASKEQNMFALQSKNEKD